MSEFTWKLLGMQLIDSAIILYSFSMNPNPIIQFFNLSTPNFDELRLISRLNLAFKDCLEVTIVRRGTFQDVLEVIAL